MPDTLAFIPVVERVVEDVVTTINETVSVNNGYPCTLSVQRIKANATYDPNDFEPGNGVVLLQGDRERVTPDVNMTETWRQNIVVVARVSAPDDSVPNIEQLLQSAGASIHHALCLDRRREKWAIDTVAGGIRTNFDNPNATTGIVEADVAVTYRHEIDNPFVCPFRS